MSMNIEQLLKDMTLEEKASLCSGKNFWETKAVERLGIGVSLTQGDYCNLKITTPEDLAVAEALFAWREQQ